MPIVGALLLLACLHATQQPNLQQQVDYTTKAAPLVRVLKDLSSRTNINLDCDTQLDDEPIILLFNKTPLQTAMDKIATVFGGEWIKTDKGYKLQFGKQADEMHEAIVQAREKKIKEAVDKFLSDPDFSHDYTPEFAKSVIQQIGDAYEGKAPPTFDLVAEQRVMPARHLFARLLKSMDLHEVAKLGNPDSITFSNDPNNSEQQLWDASNEIDEYLQEQANVVAAIKAYSAKNASETQLLLQNFGQSLAESEKPRLLLQARQLDDEYTISLWVKGSEGRDLGQAWLTMNFHPRGDEETQAKSDGIIANIGPPSTQIADYFRQRKAGKRIEPDENLSKAFLAPTTYEPLSLRTSDLILDLARKHNVNAAVLPPENGEPLTFAAAPQGSCDLQALAFGFNVGGATNLQIKDGWLIGNPIDPKRAVQTHFPRSVGEEYLNTVVEHGFPTIDDGAALESEIRPDTIRDATGIARAYLKIKGYPWETFWDRRILAFYQTLNQTQRTTAERETLRLTSDQLTSDQFVILRNMLVQSGAPLQPEPPPNADPLLSNPIAIPADIVGDGLPAGSYIELTKRSTPMGGFPVKNRQIETTQYENLSGIAFVLANKTNPKSYVSGLDSDHLMFARKETLHVSIRLGNYSFEDDLEGPPSGSDKLYTLEDFLKLLTDGEREEFKNDLQQARADPGRSGSDEPQNPSPQPPTS